MVSRLKAGTPHVDEFDVIARLLRPLTDGAPEALGLLDDAAVLAARPGYDLVISKDMIVEGVHFLASDPLDLVARKLLRVNLSDLAAKAAAPYGYFLAVSWPQRTGWAGREAFAQGLRTDQDAFGVTLFGGDTTSTPGPLTASATVLGWAPAGGVRLRSTAVVGDVVLVSGVIGDGWLGLQAALGALAAPGALERYRLPQPRLGLRSALALAHACADVSDGLLADAGHIALASRLGVEIDLALLPLSVDGQRYVASAPDRVAALVRLATGGDDYELVCTAPAENVAALVAAAQTAGVAMTVVGRTVPQPGVTALVAGRVVEIGQTGYRHG